MTTGSPEGLPTNELIGRVPEPLALVISGLTLAAIQAEATRAHVQHGEFSMLGQDHTSGDRLAILTEEVGEVAREMNEGRFRDSGVDRIAMIKELTQVAAMAASWIQVLESQRDG